MIIDVNKYLECRNPSDPLALFPEGALDRLIDGFCFFFKSGVSILYPKVDNPDSDLCANDPDSQFGRFESSGGREWYHPFCANFRSCDAHDRRCKAFDAEMAVQYWIDPEKSPNKYECHMGLIDMTYPLRIGGRTIAVVFAGQLIPRDRTDRIGLMIDKIAEPSTQKELHERLAANIQPRAITADMIEQVFEKFVEFGSMLEGLLNKLYAQQWEAARRRFLNDIVRELSQEASVKEWRVVLEEVLRDFLQLTKLAGLKVYRRRQSRFEIWGQVSIRGRSGRENAPSIPARLVAVIPDSRLTSPEELRGYGLGAEDLDLLQNVLALGQRNVQLFVQRPREHRTLTTDVLLAISGTIEEHDRDFIQDFCETVALRVRVTSLVLTLQAQGADFEERVGHVGHTAKLPLQMAVQKLEDLTKLYLVGSQPYDDIFQCRRSIRIAKFYMREIYTAPAIQGRPTEIRQLLTRVLVQTRELSRQRGCCVNMDVEELYNPSVRDQGNLEIVFTNLVDNATKYADPGGDVNVRLREWGADTTAVEIENVGQGIPPTHIELVREGHNRWVPSGLSDVFRRRREGQGLGLSMAIKYVEEHGGWVDISSRPEEERYQNDTRSHWKTRMTVGLPIMS